MPAGERDEVGPAMQFAPVGVESVLFEEIAQAGSPWTRLDRRSCSSAWNAKINRR